MRDRADEGTGHAANQDDRGAPPTLRRGPGDQIEDRGYAVASQLGLSTALSVLGFIRQMLVLGGTSGLVTRQVREAGSIRFAGFALTYFGGFLLTGFSVVGVLVFPWLAQPALGEASLPPPLGLLLYTLIGLPTS